MHIRRSERPLQAVIPTASMADIAFLLIIFFMVTTAYSLDRTPMELPQTREQQQTSKGAAIIAITEDGSFHFSEGEADTRPVNGIDELTSVVQGVTAANRLHQFVIKADRRLKYAEVRKVMRVINQAGFPGVGLETHKKGQPAT